MPENTKELWCRIIIYWSQLLFPKNCYQMTKQVQKIEYKIMSFLYKIWKVGGRFDTGLGLSSVGERSTEYV